MALLRRALANGKCQMLRAPCCPDILHQQALKRIEKWAAMAVVIVTNACRARYFVRVAARPVMMREKCWPMPRHLIYSILFARRPPSC